MINAKTPIQWGRISIALFLMLLVFTNTLAQQTSEPNFRRLLQTSQLREDFQTFRSTLTENHPDLYRYRPRESIDRLLDSCQKSIVAPMNLIAFGNLIRFAVSAIECGHTSGSLPGELMEQYASSVAMFPLKLWFAGGRAFVLCSKEANAPVGSEILSIDGEPIEQIRQKLFSYLPSDGKIQTKKNATLNNDAFQFLYNFVYGEKIHFRTRLAMSDGQVRDITLLATKFENTQCPAYKTGNNTKPLEFSLSDNTRALLTIRTFSKDRISNAGQDFPVFLDSIFNQLEQREIRHLVIDLRGNGGGDDIYGALLYSYLTNETFRYFSVLQSKSKPLMTSDDHPGLAIQQPANINFKKKVYVLTDGRTFSTAADFCAIVRSNARGVFVGEETGGSYEGNNSGGTVRVNLPHSGIRLAVPTVRYSNAVKPGTEPGRGIIPDYAVIPSILDMLAEKDVQLEKALEIAHRE
ncbi:S41 family peptidase [Dyadobacter pollutisoli]|jgi:C-terminal processing protease CtpA/Prc|uniref:S41 family peptidase n=1 Tax=Dyadobacter pollutisoli TaxID=2910158 RepID=A0A9E8SIL0_9BACT|nr:S41 family peptidase [Dyadobacter pollutisoli]WAC09254.1 S41 family peptidase [Dyadobacter pollutisoli]